MTIDEITQGLRAMKSVIGVNQFTINEAIKALEQEPATKNDLEVDKFDKAINQSDLEEWIIETFPDWCEGDVRLIMDHMDEMPSVTPQEPFINKPCVSGEVCEHDKQKVLEKIRAEILEYIDDLDIADAICEIFDKYEAESEATDGNVD